jgi:hypothetical protein
MRGLMTLEQNGETMKTKNDKRTIFLLCATLGVVLAMTLSNITSARNNGAQDDGRTDRVQQGLAGGTLVDTATREKLGLVTVGGGCSGTMIRDNWVLTAAHCVDDPDPANPGRFITAADNSVTITANWRTAQRRQSMRVISFRPYDVAIIRIAERFSGPTNDGFNWQAYEGGLLQLPITAYGRGRFQLAQGTGATAMPSQGDGQYRMAKFKTSRQEGEGGDHLVWYPSVNGRTILGGDSGGPSFTTGPADDLLVGVHARCHSTCLPGKDCSNNNWDWVDSNSECADTPLAPIWGEINRYLGAFVPTRQFIGKFAATPPGYQPMWVYTLKHNGELMWYRKESNASNWLGPKTVNNGWTFQDVIPAGGNAFFALTKSNELVWYRHDGFNDGSGSWRGPVKIGNSWHFSKIFSGGEGIIYAVKDDGTLLWYRYGNYSNASGYASWVGPKVVGAGWTTFKEIFSTGQGVIYGVKPDGKLMRYLHKGYVTGDSNWSGPRSLGSGWQNYHQIMPVGSGVILAITDDGQMVLRRYLGDEHSEGPIGPIANSMWEGPTPIGNGWVGFKKAVALLPANAPVVR